MNHINLKAEMVPVCTEYLSMIIYIYYIFEQACNCSCCIIMYSLLIENNLLDLTHVIRSHIELTIAIINKLDPKFL